MRNNKSAIEFEISVLLFSVISDFTVSFVFDNENVKTKICYQTTSLHAKKKNTIERNQNICTRESDLSSMPKLYFHVRQYLKPHFLIKGIKDVE